MSRFRIKTYFFLHVVNLQVRSIWVHRVNEKKQNIKEVPERDYYYLPELQLVELTT